MHGQAYISLAYCNEKFQASVAETNSQHCSALCSLPGINSTTNKMLNVSILYIHSKEYTNVRLTTHKMKQNIVKVKQGDTNVNIKVPHAQ